MPPKLQKNVASKQKNDGSETGNVTPRRSRRNSTKNDEEIISLGNSAIKGKWGAVGVKRKADEELTREKAGKNSKFDPSTVPNAETNISPRRSSRGVVPNRKFKDMEVDFTPGRKQTSKVDIKFQSHNATQKKHYEQNPNTHREKNKYKRNTQTTNKNKKSNNSNTIIDLTMTECGETQDDEDNDKETSTQSKDKVNEIITTLEDKNKVVPAIKIVKFDKDNNMEITDFNPKENVDILLERLPDESDTPDFSIIQEEDLEKITSELLELAQHAEEENNELQQMMFKDSSQNESNLCVSTDLGDTAVKIEENQPESENGNRSNEDQDFLSVKSADDQDSALVNDNNIVASNENNNATSKSCESVDKNQHGLINQNQSGNDNCVNENKKSMATEDKVIETVMVENIMQKKTSPKLDLTCEEDIGSEDNGLNKLDLNSDKEKNDISDEVKPGSSNGDEDFSNSDVIPITFEDSEIQLAVKNALIQLTEKSAEREEQEKEAEHDENTVKEKPENVSSSGTQTATEGNVIKLPAINVKSRNLPVVKSIKVEVESYQGDESKKQVKTDADSKEYIIVHVPDGQVVKRSSVRVNKPEDCIPFSIDEDGIYHCGACDYQNDKKVNLFKHRKKHVEEKPHCCPYCNYKTSTSSNLKRHISIHQDIRNFRCHLCNTTFRQKIHLERHIRYRHEEKKVKCPLCDYLCANENPDLKVHMKRRHLPQDSDDGTISAYKCNECDLMTVSKKDFKQHMKFHRTGPELKLFCENCSFVTDCESRLRRHSYIHSKEKPFKCGMCEYRASQKEHVVRHMRSQHGIEIERKSRRNEEEDSLDGSVDSRDESLDTKETGENKSDKFDYSSQEKIFACNHCSMKFSKLLNLYKHLHAQHKEILPEQTDNEFLCVVCDFKTTTKKNLLVHMRKHNQIDQIPPSHVYSCVLCNYINPKRRNLFQHMKKKHGIEIVMKDDGSTSCFVTDGSVIASKCDETVQNILTVGDLVTTETEEQELQIVTDDLEKDGIQVQNVISFDDIAYAVSHPQPHNRNLIVVEPNSALVQEHEAAEAIEGLQALAEQPGIITCPEVIKEVKPHLVTMVEEEEEEEEEEEKSKPETEVDDDVEKDDIPDEAADKMETEDGIQLTADEVMHLSAGDFVEINGEMYKVEISEDTGLNTDIVTSTS